MVSAQGEPARVHDRSAARPDQGDEGRRFRHAVALRGASRAAHADPGLLNDAEEQLAQLRGAETGSTADVARHLLQTLRHGAGLLDQALRHTAAAALNVGVPAQRRGRVGGSALPRRSDS